MGNAASKYTAQGKLAAELPAVKKMEYNDNWIKVDTSMGVFADEKDKEQFIYAIIAITTANGSLDLTGADYKLFYSGRQSPSPSKQPSQPNTSSATKPPSPTSASKAGNDEDDLLYATITALQSNRIVAKIEPSTGGVDQREAFLALKRDVERMLEGWLQSVPSANLPSTTENDAGPDTSLSSLHPLPHDLPPSYQSSAGIDSIVGRREKA